MSRPAPILLATAALLGALTLLSGCTDNPTVAPAMTRSFPQNTLRGTMAFGTDRQVRLNGNATSLTPASHVRNQDNVVVAPETLAGGRYLVHYTLDIGGAQVRDVWILRPSEASVKPWPQTLEQAQTWRYDAATLTWIKQ